MVTEEDMLLRLLSNCILCGSVLEPHRNAPDVKACPLSHGCAYVVDTGERHNVVFEPSFEIVPRKKNGHGHRGGHSLPLVQSLRLVRGESGSES